MFIACSIQPFFKILLTLYLIAMRGFSHVTELCKLAFFLATFTTAYL